MFLSPITFVILNLILHLVYILTPSTRMSSLYMFWQRCIASYHMPCTTNWIISITIRWINYHTIKISTATNNLIWLHKLNASCSLLLGECSNSNVSHCLANPACGLLIGITFVYTYTLSKVLYLQELIMSFQMFCTM